MVCFKNNLWNLFLLKAENKLWVLQETQININISAQQSKNNCKQPTAGETVIWGAPKIWSLLCGYNESGQQEKHLTEKKTITSLTYRRWPQESMFVHLFLIRISLLPSHHWHCPFPQTPSVLAGFFSFHHLPMSISHGNEKHELHKYWIWEQNRAKPEKFQMRHF